jgi:hypothetical protein
MDVGGVSGALEVTELEPLHTPYDRDRDDADDEPVHASLSDNGACRLDDERPSRSPGRSSTAGRLSHGCT